MDELIISKGLIDELHAERSRALSLGNTSRAEFLREAIVAIVKAQLAN